MPGKTPLRLAKMLKKADDSFPGRSKSKHSIRALKKKVQKHQAGKKFTGPANAKKAGSKGSARKKTKKKK